MAAKSIENWKTNAFDIPFPTPKSLCAYCGKIDPVTRCSVCKTGYCNRKCQTDAWPMHKIVCKQNIHLILKAICDRTFVSRMMYMGTIVKDIATKIQNGEDIEDTFDNVRKEDDLKFYKLDTPFEGKLCGFGMVTAEETGIFGDYPEEHVPIVTEEIEFVISGCSIAQYLPLAFCINLNTQSVTSEMIAMISFLAVSLHAGETHIPSLLCTLQMHHCQGYNDDVYEFPRGNCSLPMFFFNRVASTPNVGLYIVCITPENEKGSEMTDFKNIKEGWKFITSHKPHSSHYFMILQVGDLSCLVQSYYGHYTFVNWCDFSKPLVQISTPPGGKKEWFRKIIPHPKHRKIMDLADAKLMFDEIEMLCEVQKKEDMITAYSNITGIEHDNVSISTRYLLRFAYMDLNRLLYKQ